MITDTTSQESKPLNQENNEQNEKKELNPPPNTESKNTPLQEDLNNAELASPPFEEEKAVLLPSVKPPVKPRASKANPNNAKPIATAVNQKTNGPDNYFWSLYEKPQKTNRCYKNKKPILISGSVAVFILMAGGLAWYFSRSSNTPAAVDHEYYGNRSNGESMPSNKTEKNHTTISPSIIFNEKTVQIGPQYEYNPTTTTPLVTTSTKTASTSRKTTTKDLREEQIDDIKKNGGLLPLDIGGSLPYRKRSIKLEWAANKTATKDQSRRDKLQRR